MNNRAGSVRRHHVRAASLAAALITILVLPISGCNWDFLEGRSLPSGGPSTELILRPRAPYGWPGDTPNVTEAGRFYFSGQPGEAGLRHAASKGITVVVSLRTEEELAGLPFDEAALVGELGMAYVNIPVTPSSFSLEDVERFAEYVNQRRIILAHDDTSDRAGAMWAALLLGWTDRSLETCIELGLDAGLRSEDMVEALRRVSPSLEGRQRKRSDWPSCG
jgi:protein tyrosine phosphatase (PTP) superfamily phosphohydrolase (DUF442 family)